ncbi:MAG: protoglobin family protein [Pirellulales bacterium]
MKTIDEQQLELDAQYRYQYLCEFIGFGAEDIACIHASVGHMAPRIPQLVERTYERLLAYDATARHFVPRQHGHDGEVPTNLAELSQQHAQIKFRKEHLLRYLMQLIGSPYNARMVTYLDMVGKMHTPKAGNKAIDVPLVQMNALMGLLSDLLLELIHELPLEPARRNHTSRAFQKLLWIQNDFITRHYQTTKSA